MVLYHVPDPHSGHLRATRSADTAAAYVIAWAILHPAEADEQGVPVVVDGRRARITSAAANLLDRAAVTEALVRLG